MYPCHHQLHHIDPCLKGPFLSQLGLEHPPGERPVSSRRVYFYVHMYILRYRHQRLQPWPFHVHVHAMSCHVTVLGHPIPLSSPFVKILDCLGPFLPLGPPSLNLQILHGFGQCQTQKTDRLTARPGLLELDTTQDEVEALTKNHPFLALLDKRKHLPPIIQTSISSTTSNHLYVHYSMHNIPAAPLSGITEIL